MSLKPVEKPVIHEVGLRDGLQAEKQVIPTATKLAWCEQLIAAQVDVLQIGSFVNPDKMPQMADTDELFRRLNSVPHPGVTLSGLVLNEKGLERALACGVELVCMGVSASDTHSQKNTGMSTAEAQRRIIAIAQAAVKAGKQVQVSVQSAFGCGFEGKIPDERVLGIVRAYLDAGLVNISLADTAGHAHPTQVTRLFGELFKLQPDAKCACHFHDTYGLGMANMYAALALGVRSFETSFGGLGGCPFTKLAAGNVATEDFVHGLQRVGMRGDIQLSVLLGLAREVGTTFGRDLPGRVHKAGALTY